MPHWDEALDESTGIIVAVYVLWRGLRPPYKYDTTSIHCDDLIPMARVFGIRSACHWDHHPNHPNHPNQPCHSSKRPSATAALRTANSVYELARRTLGLILEAGVYKRPSDNARPAMQVGGLEG